MQTLKHFGVLGMRWGRRKDKVDNSSEDHLKVQKLKTKKLNEMSNKEIQEVNNRLNLESQYKRLNPTKIERGKVTVGQVLSVVGTLTAAASAITTLSKVGKNVFNNLKDKGVV